MTNELQAVIERAWDERETIGPGTKGEARQAVDAARADGLQHNDQCPPTAPMTRAFFIKNKATELASNTQPSARKQSP